MTENPARAIVPDVPDGSAREHAARAVREADECASMDDADAVPRARVDVDARVDGTTARAVVEGCAEDGGDAGEGAVRVEARVAAWEARGRAGAGAEATSAAAETPETPRVRASDLESGLVDAFRKFGSFGRRKSDGAGGAGESMDATRFAKACREAIFRGEEDVEEKLRQADVAFAKRAKLLRRVDFDTFRTLVLEDCVEILGEGASPVYVARKLMGVAPSVGDAISPGKFRLHDDKSTYTGISAEIHGLERSPSRRAANPPIDVDSLPEVRGLHVSYKLFLQFSPSLSSGLTCTRWLKLCEDCGLFAFDPNAFDATRAGIVFNSLAGTKSKVLVDFKTFKHALALAARVGGRSYLDFAKAVAQGKPIVRSGVLASPERFHDDPSTYTATHREVHRDKVPSPRALSIRERDASQSAA